MKYIYTADFIYIVGSNIISYTYTDERMQRYLPVCQK